VCLAYKGIQFNIHVSMISWILGKNGTVENGKGKNGAVKVAQVIMAQVIMAPVIRPQMKK